MEETRGNYNHLLSGIDRCISKEDNQRLTCWHIIGDDVTNFCLQILNEGMEVKQIISTHILFIPKIANPSNMKHFRPINLCNVIYKILAKAIANRLRGVIEKCIDMAQSALVPGRLISDNVLLANEILHTLKQKRLGKKGFMAVKLDMSKAYDRVEWNFIKEIMVRMGFAINWIETLMKCLTTVSYSVVVNGYAGENFRPIRELRQGDPLSPFLFLICGEGLSCLMRLATREGLLKRIKASKSGPQVSHLLFADDCILFGEATNRGATLLKGILREYRICSSQCVNFDKSTVFFSRNTSEDDRHEVVNILGVQSSNDLESYLELPNMVGRKKRESFQNLKDRLKKRIDNWSEKEVFIKAILQSISTYTMACFLLPKSLCAELESIIANIWWQKGRENGGLGFRNISQFNIALLAKQGWRLINHPNSLLARVLKAKYYPLSLTWKSVWAAKGLLQRGCAGGLEREIEYLFGIIDGFQERIQTNGATETTMKESS
ncbi:reverse transcriptase [Gossypium australe]|uniref:Reverse transcriptase n=1 Tax=Gossypium australe TaxID=47621 RepID=A0A5B6X7N6_9ROSI|nr:reverse transcriptase [Gossypium australe]